MSTVVWAVIGVGAAAVAVAVLMIRSSRAEDLGSVSEQWIAHHRAGPDPQH